ncbi:MAG: CvpA family protein [Liquorilactobacillus ghanensis]|jgi:uncharacterized membrane protein required for colicin V production|uniref:CvpA family protein n=1 Tax=Liquorilactobacillus ghanensis DSM 18630 TaxID=1423750 RepID=A0A0R1VM45_9LACO|nr:CvpA family protein [Liquorilactobacillus ghanensis]KRM06463.1 hypothetical protein FC89_GL000608 [Liquorilactobacillus ghanensis DSM 18630]
MLISILIAAILVIAYFRGAARGLIQMILDLLSGAVLIWLASWLAPVLGKLLQPFLTSIFTKTDFPLTNQLGYWLAYVLILLIGGMIVSRLFRIFSIFTRVTKLPIIHGLNAISGGILAVIFTIVLIFIGLKLLTAWPNVSLHQAINNSSVAQLILQRLPELTSSFFN